MTERFSRWFCKKAEVVDDYEIRVVVYFFELMWFQIYETAIILGLAYLLGLLPQVFLCMLGFLPVRMSAKGIHANTKLKCILYSTSLFLLLGYIGSYFNWFICILLGILSALLLRKPKK